MLCDNCKENQATIHYTEIINGVRNEHHLCGECARKLDFSGSSKENDFPFVRLFTGLMAASEGQDNPMRHVNCPGCGMSFEEYSMVLKFGCAECYNVFGPLLEDSFKKIHGDSKHKGKQYICNQNIDDDGSKEMKTNDELPQLAKLELMLREAIEIENFEEAARLRDEIKKLKGV